jgi:hypothetical protein
VNGDAADGAGDVAAEAAGEPGGADAAPDAGVAPTPDAAGWPDAIDGPQPSPDGSTCDDQLQDGDETDVDCGGSCAPCGPNKACVADADCAQSASGCDTEHGGCRCDATTRRCVHDHCLDHKTDDGETALDCGGGLCRACATGDACKVDDDCTPGGCDAVTFKCVFDRCINHRQDGTETDVDCGGLLGICARCAMGRKCEVNADCQSGHTCSTDGSLVCQ